MSLEIVNVAPSAKSIPLPLAFVFHLSKDFPVGAVKVFVLTVIVVPGAYGLFESDIVPVPPFLLYATAYAFL